MSATFPTHLGRLQQVRHIGAGAFASVWLYYDPDLDSHVAVKALSPGWVSNPEIHQRFLQEARLLRSVDSPHVVRVYDIGQTSTGIPFFVMSYADGGSVADLLKGSPGGLDVCEVADIVSQAADGLMALKARGVIHRDIKPANLLLTSETSGGIAGARRVMIADLGVARSLDSLNEVTRDIGTPSYMAPEQLDPDLPIDHRADVRALGAVAWALLAGRSPAPALGLTSRVPEAGTVRPLPASISQAIGRALEPRAGDRWPDARSFGDALRAAAQGTRTPPAHAAPQPPPPTSPWQKSAAQVPPVGPPSVPPPSGSPFDQPTTVPTGAGSQQRPKKRTGLLVGGAIAAVVVIGLVAGLILFLGRGGDIPEAGECRDLDFDAGNTFVDETAPVDCSEPHTLYTFHVATDVKNYNDNEAAGAACYSRIETGLGLRPEMLARTAYLVNWYWPKESTWNDGDRYVRCDIVVTVLKAPLIDLPEDPIPAPADLRACIDSTVDKIVHCGTTHDYVVVDTFEMTGDTYPDQAETNVQGLAGCPTEATMFQPPFESAWNSGSRIGLCAKYDAES
ncbi:protein kinase [Nocardioides sp. NPDC057772]|uniref:serine/threonine-protein kinase n=1 Tax=Nocardioides sp. NPDC057772 TaxID=3346245 RepID=UPI00366DFD5E